MKRIGLFASGDRANYLRSYLGNAFVDFRDAAYVPLDTALAAWQASGMDVVVIDDASCPDKYEEEEILLRWAQSALSGYARIIFVSDAGREINDPFFFQLVSTTDVKDIIHTPIGHTIEQTLPLRLETPTAIQEVSYWKTDDKKKLIRASQKKGLIGAIERKREEKLRQRMLNEAQESLSELQAQIPQPQINPSTIPQVRVCGSCGAPIAEGQVFCGSCGTRYAPNEVVDTSFDSERTHPIAMQHERLSADEIINADIEEDLNYEWLDIEKGSDMAKKTPIITEVEEVEIAQPIEESEEISSKAYEVAQAFEPTGDLSPSVSEAILSDSEIEGLETKLTSPTAKNIVAVAGSRHGVGATYLTCALAFELCGKGAKTSVAISNPSTFEEMQAMLSPKTPKTGHFSYRNVDFYAYNKQRDYADNYDVVVVDCGKVDYPDNDINSPALLFERANHKTMLCSGAPWDVLNVVDMIGRLGKDTLAQTKWFTYSAPKTISEVFGKSIADALGLDVPVEVGYVPYRPALFTGDRSCYNHYKALLEPIVGSITSVDPEYAQNMKKA